MFERFSTGLEVRAEGRTLRGIVLKYGDVSPSHRERFEPGSIRFADAVHADLFHDPERAFAWMPGGGLTVTQGREAVAMTADVPPIPAGDRALVEVRSGRATGLSVEFRAEAERREGGIRVVERAVLHGIGLVKNPSYHQSTVEARAVANPWIRAQWKARKAGACDCQGPDCQTVSFLPGAFTESLNDGREILALAGSNRPLASRKKGTLEIAEMENGDIAVSVDELAAATEIGKSVAGEAKATRVVARPWVDVEASTFSESGGHREFSKAALRGVIIKPTVSDDGWNEVEIAGAAPVEGRKEERRRLRVYL